jgi:pyridoxal phosphate enzyme (YggS family)
MPNAHVKTQPAALMTNIHERLAQVRSLIGEAAARARRPPEDVALLAVTKTHPPEALRETLDAGQTLFGESRIQEAREKIPLLPSRARWHFIGHLQKNKIRHALAIGFELFHGVDSLDLARELARVAAERGLRVPVLLEVNVAGESTKFGFSATQLRAQFESLIALDRLQIEGLMTIAPLAPAPEDARRYFVALRELRDGLVDELGFSLPHLSMGMSSDFAVAVEEGATIVRIGSAIFGNRSAKSWRAAGAGNRFDD